MTPALAAPAALLLGALVGLPILAHLTRQRPTERVAFGAMLLVRRLVKRLRRRRQLKDRLLLALRALAVLLAVLAAAQPRLTWVDDRPLTDTPGRMVFVVDRSFSMGLQDRGGTLLARARGAAIRELRELPDGVEVGLVVYGAEALAHGAGLTTDRESLVARLETLEPELGPGDLRAGLLEARRMLGGEPGEIVLFTDEAGPAMIPAATAELARIVDAGSAVRPEPIVAEPPRNVAITEARYGDGLEGGTLTVRVANFGPDPLEVPCVVNLPDGADIPVFVDLPGEGPAEARVTVPREARGGIGTVSCDDPDLPADDTRWFHLPDVGATRVLVVDGDPGDTPTQSEVYFLERALAPWGGGQSGVKPDVISPSGLGALDPAVHGTVFLANVSDPRPHAERLRDFVRGGGTLVIGVGDNVSADRYAAAFGSLMPAALDVPRTLAGLSEDPIPVQPPDVSLSLFRPFARGGRGSFRRIGVRRVFTVEPYTDGRDVTTLLRLEGGMPALIERRVGGGRVVLWTSTFDQHWSDLGLQAVFMPLVQRLAGVGGAGANATREDALVGDVVTLALPEGTDEVVVERGDGARISSRRDGSRVVFRADEPGGYAVRIPDGPAIAWVAVNLDPVESDVRRTHSVAAVEAALEPDLFTRHVELSQAALGGALIAMLLSAGLAVFGRAREGEEAEAPVAGDGLDAPVAPGGTP